MYSKKVSTFATANAKGAIAQLVEQRTENPCVPGSIPGGTTQKAATFNVAAFCFYTSFALLFGGRVEKYICFSLSIEFVCWVNVGQDISTKRIRSHVEYYIFSLFL